MSCHDSVLVEGSYAGRPAVMEAIHVAALVRSQGLTAKISCRAAAEIATTAGFLSFHFTDIALHRSRPSP
jgi:hypothetical protein